MGNKQQPRSLGDILAQYDWDKKKYISQEWQDYAYRLAIFLDDLKHKSLYMRLAKNTPRAILEAAKNFVTDAYQVKNKAKLFMWKLKEIKCGSTQTGKFLAHFKIYGRVQGVGFRYWARGKMKELGLDGKVWNNDDGTVGLDAVLSSKAETKRLAEILKQGPALARVDKVVIL